MFFLLLVSLAMARFLIDMMYEKKCYSEGYVVYKRIDCKSAKYIAYPQLVCDADPENCKKFVIEILKEHGIREELIHRYMKSESMQHGLHKHLCDMNVNRYPLGINEMNYGIFRLDEANLEKDIETYFQIHDLWMQSIDVAILGCE